MPSHDPVFSLSIVIAIRLIESWILILSESTSVEIFISSKRKDGIGGDMLSRIPQIINRHVKKA